MAVAGEWWWVVGRVWNWQSEGLLSAKLTHLYLGWNWLLEGMISTKLARLDLLRMKLTLEYLLICTFSKL